MMTSETKTADAVAKPDWRAVANELAGGAIPEPWQRLVSSPHARVFYNRDRNIYLKCFYEPRLRNRIKALLLPPLSRYRSFARNSQWLSDSGFTAPPIVAYGTTDSGVGYVLTKGFNGMGLGSFCSQYLVRSSTDVRIRRWKRKVMVALGEELARLHNSGVSHGDLRPDNILLSCTSPEPVFCFIDNERNKRHPLRTPFRAIVKNLSQLNMIWPEDLSASYRIRFVDSYIANSSRGIDKKALVRRIDRITGRRLKDKVRGGYLKADKRQMCTPDFGAILG